MNRSMPDDSRDQTSTAVRVALYLLAWTVFGLFFFTQAAASSGFWLGSRPFRALLLSWLVQAYIWAALTPVVIWFARTVGFEHRRVLPAVAHISASFVCAYFASVLLCVVAPRPGFTAQGSVVQLDFIRQMVTEIPTGFHHDLFAYWIVFGSYYMVRSYRRFTERMQHTLSLEAEAAALSAALADAELTYGRGQFQPQFVLDTLAAITRLVEREEMDQAEELLTALGDLLRFVLDDIDTPRVPLRRELDHLRAYLAVEHLRLDGRLRVTIDAGDSTVDAAVMPVLLPPIVRDVLSVALGGLDASVRLTISSARIGGFLEIEIECASTNGVPEPVFRDLQHAAERTRLRLAQSNIGRSQAHVVERAAGTAIVLLIPYEAATLAPAASEAASLPSRAASPVPLTSPMDAQPDRPSGRHPSHWRGWNTRLANAIWCFVLWTGFGLFQFSDDLRLRHQYSAADMLVIEMIVAYSWLILTPLVNALVKRVPIEAPRRARHALAHIGFSVLFATAVVLMWSATTLTFRLGSSMMTMTLAGVIIPGVITGFLQHVFTYWIIVVVAHVIRYQRAYGDRDRQATVLETRASDLKAELRRAQLSALKAQLEPHFLFNAMNATMVLVRQRNQSEAVEMLRRLRALMECVVRDADSDEVTLDRELEYVRKYLAVEQVRFKDRLRTEIAVSDDLLGAAVPYMCLQPIVENAVRHGIARSSARGTIRISASAERQALKIQVHDDGPGLGRPGLVVPMLRSRPGVGLSNTINRLHKLYGPGGTLALEARPHGGAVATIVVPYRRIEASSTQLPNGFDTSARSFSR